jgi:hypothetical protein
MRAEALMPSAEMVLGLAMYLEDTDPVASEMLSVVACSLADGSAEELWHILATFSESRMAVLRHVESAEQKVRSHA